MRTAPHVIIGREYSALREEIRTSMKYVFERPLLIITAFAGILQSPAGALCEYLPLMAFSVLFFNLWFTNTRFRSAARAAAYIHVVLERQEREWVGWETSIREYRKWKNNPGAHARRSAIQEGMDQSAIPKSAMFYGPTVYLHLLGFGLALAASAVMAFGRQPTASTVSFYVTLAFVSPLAVVAWRLFCPRQTLRLVEERRACWRLALPTTPWELGGCESGGKPQ